MEYNEIDKNSSWGSQANNVNTNFQKTDVEIEKLWNKAEEQINNKGIFDTDTSLKTSYPASSNKKGFFAFVGSKDPFVKWEVQVDGGEWLNTNQSVNLAMNLTDYAKTKTDKGIVVRTEDGTIPKVDLSDYATKVNEIGDEVVYAKGGRVENGIQSIVNVSYIDDDYKIESLSDAIKRIPKTSQKLGMIIRYSGSVNGEMDEYILDNIGINSTGTIINETNSSIIFMYPIKEGVTYSIEANNEILDILFRFYQKQTDTKYTRISAPNQAKKIEFTAQEGENYVCFYVKYSTIDYRYTLTINNNEKKYIIHNYGIADSGSIYKNTVSDICFMYPVIPDQSYTIQGDGIEMNTSFRFYENETDVTQKRRLYTGVSDTYTIIPQKGENYVTFFTRNPDMITITDSVTINGVKIYPIKQENTTTKILTYEFVGQDLIDFNNVNLWKPITNDIHQENLFLTTSNLIDPKNVLIDKAIVNNQLIDAKGYVIFRNIAVIPNKTYCVSTFWHMIAKDITFLGYNNIGKVIQMYSGGGLFDTNTYVTKLDVSLAVYPNDNASYASEYVITEYNKNITLSEYLALPNIPDRTIDPNIAVYLEQSSLHPLKQKVTMIPKNFTSISDLEALIPYSGKKDIVDFSDIMPQLGTYVRGAFYITDIVHNNWRIADLPVFKIYTEDKKQWTGEKQEKKQVKITLLNTPTDIVYQSKDSWNYDRISGRGNSTWQVSFKKPYRFRLKEKVSFFGLEPSKNWVLLANPLDDTLMSNDITYTITRLFRDDNRYKYSWFVPRTQQCLIIVNDSIRGIYTFTDHISKIEKGRVDISDDGYIFEIDLRAKQEQSSPNDYAVVINDKESNGNKWAITGLNQYVTIKTLDRNDDGTYPDEVTTKMKYAEDYLNKCGLALKSGIVEDIDALIDMHTFVDWLIPNEFYGTTDTFQTSSYMHKDEGGIDDRLRFGPIWDFDSGYGFEYANYKTYNYKEFKLNNLRETTWIRSMLSVPKYKADFEKRMIEFCNLMTTKGVAYAKQQMDMLTPYCQLEYSWYNLRRDSARNLKNFHASVCFSIRWIELRAKWIIENIDKY